MQIGLTLPQADGEAGMPTWSMIARTARQAEDAGLDGLWVYDHLLLRLAGEAEVGIHEAWSLLAGLAAITTRIRLGSIVMATPFRPAALLAKMAATVDEIAGGRLILGLGCGWHEPEFRAFGYPFDHLVGRFEDAIEIIAPLLRGDRVTHRGRWSSVEDAALLPPPTYPIPILIAGKGDRMLGLTARHAAMWNAAWFGLPDDRWRDRRDRLVAACVAAGRDPATIGLTAGIRIDGADTTTAAGSRRIPLAEAAIVDALGVWAGEGVVEVQVELEPETDPVFGRAIELLARARTQLAG